MIIYKVVNNISKKIYIGQTTVSIKERWQHHCTPSKRTKSVLSRSIQKHGRENFTIEQIDSADTLEELNEKESIWIKRFNSLVPNGYNLQSGGKNTLTHPDTKIKLSLAGKGRKISQNHIDIIRKRHSIFVYQYSLNGSYLRSFSSITEASNILKIDNSDISKNCKLKKRHAGGFQWSFELKESLLPVRPKEKTSKKGRISPNRKKIAKIDSNGIVIEIYESAQEASLKNNCDHSSICKVCNGKLKHIKNMLFIFLENSR